MAKESSLDRKKMIREEDGLMVEAKIMSSAAIYYIWWVLIFFFPSRYLASEKIRLGNAYKQASVSVFK